MRIIMIDEGFPRLLPRFDVETNKSLQNCKNEHNEVDGQNDHKAQLLHCRGFGAKKNTLRLMFIMNTKLRPCTARVSEAKTSIRAGDIMRS